MTAPITEPSGRHDDQFGRCRWGQKMACLMRRRSSSHSPASRPITSFMFRWAWKSITTCTPNHKGYCLSAEHSWLKAAVMKSQISTLTATGLKCTVGLDWKCEKCNADLCAWSDLDPKGLCLSSPAAGDAPVVLRLNHLVLILHIRPQTVPRGLGVAAGAARSVLAKLWWGLRGGVPGGGEGRRGARVLYFGGRLAGCSRRCIDPIACSIDVIVTHLSGS